MKLTYIPDEELSKLPKVKTEAIVKRGKFHPEGLFSEQIFGPVKSYKCWCNTTTASENQRCRQCGIKITSSSMRRKQFAVIEVDRLINPVAMEILNFNKKIAQYISKLLNMKVCLYLTEERKVIYVPLDPTSYEPNKELVAKQLNCKTEDLEQSRFLYGLDAVFEIACILCDTSSKNIVRINKLRNLIVNNQFFTKYVLVIPPDLRPAIIGKQVHLDPLNKLYSTILLMINKEIVLSSYTRHIYECRLQQIANQINKFVFENIGKKSGLLRNKMAGKRIDFSGRAVATVDPEIPLSHIKISRLILLQLWKLEIAKELIKRGDFVTFKMAFDYIQRIYEEYNIPDDLKQIIDEITTDQFIIMNRQPTLHRGGMFALKIIPQDTKVISVNPLICDPLNLDFDGDSIYADIQISVKYKDVNKTKTIKTNILDLKDLHI